MHRRIIESGWSVFCVHNCFHKYSSKVAKNLTGWLRRSGGTGETRLHYRATAGNALHPLSDASRCRLEPVLGDVLWIDTQNINPSTVSWYNEIFSIFGKPDVTNFVISNWPLINQSTIVYFNETYRFAHGVLRNNCCQHCKVRRNSHRGIGYQPLIFIDSHGLQILVGRQIYHFYRIPEVHCK